MEPEEFDVPLRGAAIAGAPDGIGESFYEEPAAGEPMEAGGGDEADPALAFRRTLGMFATGVTVVAVPVEERAHGTTVNAFMSVSLRPPLVLIAVDRRARLNALLREGLRFGVSVLGEHQADLSERFARRIPDGAPEPSWELVRGAPLVEGALAHLVARVVRSYWGGDHSLFLGQAEYVRYGEGTPLLFHGGRYERVVRHPRIFSALPDELLRPLLAAGEERTFADGERLMERGEPGVTLYLVTEGVVRVERPGRTVHIRAGELVGEIEILDPGGGRLADVVADGPVRTIAVARDDVRAALESRPEAAWALLGVLASRFRENA